jgi:hypothetical protein
VRTPFEAAAHRFHTSPEEQQHTCHRTQVCHSSSSQVARGGVPYGFVRVRVRRGGGCGFRHGKTNCGGGCGYDGGCYARGSSVVASVVANVKMKSTGVFSSNRDLRRSRTRRG